MIAVGFLGWMRLILGVIWWSPLPAMAETVGVGAALLALVELGMWREVARKIGSAEAGVEEAASRLAVIKRTQRIMTASTSAILATLLIQNGAADVLFPMALGLILLSAALVVSEWRLFLPLSRFVGVGLLVSLLAAPALLQLMQVGSMFVRSALRR